MSHVPQIPWAKEVKVTKVNYSASGYAGPGIYSVDLELPSIKAHVTRGGDVDLEIDSKENIGYYMAKSTELTRSLRRYLKKRPWKFFIEGAKEWLRGGPEWEDEEPPWGKRKAGVLDWYPGYKGQQSRAKGKKGHYGSGGTSELSEYWIGSSFPFVHFRLPDGDEGLAIDWGERHEEHSNLTRVGEPRDQEVWIGDVEEFIQNNEESFESWETYKHYNDTFENGLLWSLDLMGVLAQRDVPSWVLELVGNDTDVLWAEAVEKILGGLDPHPTMEQAAMKWIQDRRREQEEASGQIYLWPREE